MTRSRGAAWILTAGFVYVWGEDAWIRQYPLPEMEDFKNAFFLNSDTGWIVGTKGAILRTEDGGVTWTSQRSPSAADLEAAHFLDGRQGWIFGRGGTLLRTRDGGQSWESLPNRTDADLRGGFFVDERTGWVVGSGGVVLHTEDGGATWSPQASGTAGNLQSVFFLDSAAGWAAGDGSWIRTVDGGRSWLSQEPSPWPNTHWTDIHFSDARNGHAVGMTWRWCGKNMACYNTLYRNTTDGGASWTWGSDIQASSSGFTKIRFSDSLRGWVGGPNGIGVSHDGGRSWRRNPAPDWSIAAAGLLGEGKGWAVGARGAIYRTQDSGITWNVAAKSWSEHYRSVHFLDSKTGWVAGTRQGGGAALRKTADGGKSWTDQAGGLGLPALAGVSFPSPEVGYAIGDGGQILKTMDGGATWSMQFRNPPNPGHLPTVSFSSLFSLRPDLAWAAGGIVVPDAATSSSTALGLIYRTTDGGANWLSQTVDSAQIHAVFFRHPDTGWAVGYGGRIVKSLDGGRSWAVRGKNQSGSLQDVHFPDGRTGYAVGSGGAVLKSTDGGNSWNSLPSGITEWLYSVRFLDKDTGWTAGTHSLFKTVDGGTHWMRVASPGLGYPSLRFGDPRHAWAVGQGGAIYKLTRDEAVSVVPRPDRTPFLSLAGNRLLFDLPVGRAVRVTLHDLRGRQAGVLLDGWRPAGSHALDLASPGLRGLYLLRFRSGTDSRALRVMLGPRR